MHQFPVIAIGASAGGLDALQRFFKTVPARPGMAFVVVTHLAPKEESLLPEILQRASKLPVKTPEHGEKIEVDHVYVRPPGRDLVYEDGAITLVDPPELQTLNAELQEKVAELQRQSDRLGNLLNSSEIATLFLDRELRVRWFTPAMQGLLELVPADVGRPLSHFAMKSDDPTLIEEAKAVLSDLRPREKEIPAGERWFTRSILPYRTTDDRIDGVVITFIDRTTHHLGQAALQAAKEYAESTIDTVRHPLLVLRGDLRVESANKVFYNTFGTSAEETVNHSIYAIAHRQWDVPRLRELLERVLPGNEEIIDYEVAHKFERLGPRTMMLNARRIHGADRILLAIEDVTEQRQRFFVSSLQHLVRNTLAVVRAIAVQTRDTSKDLETFWEAFEGRLRSLGTVQALISNVGQDHISLMDIVLEQLVALGGRLENRTSLEGPEIRLHQAAGETLALAVHELAVNAIRYGGFAAPDGLVSIQWEIDDGFLVFQWRESGLSGLRRPTRRGFGRELLEEGVSYSLGGTAELRFEPTGLRYVARLPLARTVAGIEPANEQGEE